MTEFDRLVGKNIAMLRRGSQTKLAREAGVSPSQVSRIERGQRSMTFENAVAFARALNVPLDRLYSPAAIERTEKHAQRLRRKK